MADETKAAPETPLQSKEAREAVLAKSTAGNATAVGQAREKYLGNEDERIKKLQSRGSEVPVKGKPKSAVAKQSTAPEGAQAQPAIYTTNGTVPVGMLPSGSGLQPASASIADPAAAAKAVAEAQQVAEKHLLRSGAEKISRNKIESMSAADLRAVATDRGYDLSEQGGNRVTRRRFLKLQEEDDSLGTEPKAGEETQS